MKKLLLVVAVLAGLIAIFIALRLWQDVHPSGEIGSDLTFGWIAFLWRVLPSVRIQWDGVAIFTGASITLILILHSFLSWLTTATENQESTPKPRWRWKWTIALTAVVLAIFVAGISVVGVTHQSYWLATSNEPLYGLDRPWHFRGYSPNNLKQAALSVHNTIDADNAFPSQWRNGPKQSWGTQILPYVSYVDDIDRTLEWNDPKNVRHFRAIIPMLCNPQFRTPPFRDRNGFGLNHYAGNTHLFDRTDRFTFEEAAKGGAANTLLIGEVNTQFVPWGKPENSRDPQKGIGAPEGFGGASGSPGANFAMLDGSVRLIRKDVDPKVLSALSNPKRAN
jgi:prepilin-type processing-associated H-X9-DG protein